MSEDHIDFYPGVSDAELAALPSTAERIRRLAAVGYDRSAISRRLGVRYQQVNNTLTRARKPAAGFEEAPPPWGSPRAEQVKMGRDGRVVIPAAFRERLGLAEGADLVAFVEDGGVRLLTPMAAVRRAQEIVRRHVPAGVSLVDELIADRRREAARE